MAVAGHFNFTFTVRHQVFNLTFTLPWLFDLQFLKAFSPQLPDRDLSSDVRRPRREANHSLLHTPEVKNVWSYTVTPLYF
jgi:hypothetical protein